MRSRAENVAEAQALRDDGMPVKEIAVQMGVNFKSVYDWLADPLNERSGPRKRQWDDESYRGRCEVCGVVTSRREYTRCKAHDSRRESARRQRKEIQGRWAAGETMRVIEAAMGMSKGQLGRDMARMREAGWDLPHRYNVKDGKRVAA